MHKRRPDFNSLKFTPARIHNKLELDRDAVITYFRDQHPLGDCATHFGCSKATIKRKLREWGVDTAIYNHSQLAKKRAKRSTPLLDSADLIDLYLTQNLDTKTIAGRCGVHYSTVRNRLRANKLRKSPRQVSRSMMTRHFAKYGLPHPSQRADVLIKTRSSAVRAIYTDKLGRNIAFRSLHELSYALLLDEAGSEWYYEELSIPYVDMLTGKRRIYTIDFTVAAKVTEWIEIKPQDDMIPEDKRIYAERRAEEAGVVYRGLLPEERAAGWALFLSGKYSGSIEFVQRKPRSTQTKITYWGHNKDITGPPGWDLSKREQCGAVWKATFVSK